MSLWRIGLSNVFSLSSIMFLIFSLLIPLQSLKAQSFPEVKVSGFQGQYFQDKGQANARQWQWPSHQSNGAIEFEVFKENTQLRFVAGSDEILWEEVPEFILDLKKMTWSESSLISGGQKVQAAVQSFKGEHPQNNVSLQNLAMGCEQKNKDLATDAIRACLNKGELKFSLFETSAGSPLGAMIYSFTNTEEERALGSNIKLEDLDFRINKGSFTLGVKADLEIRLSLKANGHISYQASSPNSGELTIRLDKVKAGFLNVTGKVFDELDKINSPQVRVSRPFIYIAFP